ncbi:hypothetical protein AWENTII_002316 [Aspergillus wentii]|nr:hypothetical protein MW887_008088 [Aspergillus wentii]
MTGPNMHYLPVLSVDSYLEKLRASIDAAAAFETQYDCFQDKSQLEGDLHNAGEQMLEQARERSKRTQTTFRADRFVLQNAANDLERGVQKWKEEEGLKAAFIIIIAIITFGVAIAEIALGDLEAAASIPGDIKTTEKVIEDVKKVKEVLQSQTMKNLRDCAKALYNLYTPMATSIETLKSLDWSSKLDLPTTEQVSGADGDSAAIQSLASWDKWGLQADAQMEFPVSHGIEGADAYQLALRKHAINEKQLAQTQAEAIKAGQGYIQAKLEQHLARQDIESLTQLVQNLTSEKNAYEKAQARFFDRYLALRTTIAIGMQNLIWAEKYITLSNGGVVVDPLKTVADYKADLSQIEEEIQNAKSNYSSGLQTFDYETPPNPLPLHCLSDMVQSLRMNTPPVGSPIRPHSATFTLMPRVSKNDNMSGPFTDGSHFRVSGLDVALIGVRPKVLGDLVVSLEISTSGTYADMQDGHVYNFTTLPLHREFRYRVGTDGKKHVEVTAIDTSNEYALPTPFTQWTIQVVNADDLDFSGLEEVRIDWHGKLRF